MRKIALKLVPTLWWHKNMDVILTHAPPRFIHMDQKFRFKPHVPPERREKIRQAMLAGQPLPPVRLFQIRDQFYALDGNHRIAVAKELGREDIRAHVVEYFVCQEFA